ncbi:caspase family protein [Tenacibaculum dicentrarchi]|nr:caspase family protein [Tenacibaculum dicentrarchi]MCD8419985.1 caspase family protein [Tenacibaculum dicentrarchi]MCD8438331.1 caspase family protein [Tenacibaculum dicentrarchi]WBX67924.1 caspase family protein [Tenacibaculum dicentrarchi]
MKSIKIIIYKLLIIFYANNLYSQHQATALLVGVNKYNSVNNLRNPINDCREIESKLISLGWKVKVIENPSYSSFKLQLEKFIYQSNNHKSTSIMLYFAGHGFQINDDNYLVCSDFESSKFFNKNLGSGALKLSDILYEMNSLGNKPKIIAIDACRSNPLGKNSLFISDGLAITNAPSNTLIAYSTSPGKVTYDGKTNLSPYAKGLSYSLSKYEDCFDVFLNTRLHVAYETSNKQIPWESNSLLKRFSFEQGQTSSKPELTNTNRNNSFDYNHIYFNKNSTISTHDNPIQVVENQLSEMINNAPIEHFKQSIYLPKLNINELKELYISSIRNNQKDDIAWKFRNLSDEFQQGVIYPSCRDKFGNIDYDCGNSDEQFIFFPDFQLAKFCAEEAYKRGGKCDVYAQLYEFGRGVEKNYIKAYELYRESGKRGDEYYEVNLNKMTQKLLKIGGYKINIDGVLGLQSKGIILNIVPTIGHINRTLSKKQFKKLLFAIKK